MSSRLMQFIGFVVIVTAVFVATALADSQPPSPEERLWLPPLPPAEAPPAQPINPLSSDNIPWSQLVFQSYRDGNWEIYNGGQTGMGQTRLTAHNEPDIHPRLNRGATRIVYSSYRTSDYELYVMNSNGSGQAPLTDNSTDDVNPVWSSDSTRIAFQAYRDGQAEIYVMNADGSGSTRLTAHSGYDGYPTWSPDNSKIAFVSNRTGGYRIHVMNADGSGETQLSTQPSSFHPAWSPDGSKIAYSADGDGDGWLELWVMNADGSGQQLLSTPGPLADLWARSWSPDSRYIAYTSITFINYQGNWYWTDASISSFELETHVSLPLSWNLDWHPDWQTTDITAPTSAVAPTVEIAQPPNFQIDWSGSDENSGVSGYDVQYRVGNNGVWVDWQTAVTATQAIFPATPATTVYFRSRAHDVAGNTEEWPTTPDAETTFYSWPLWGQVTDNRGLPWPGVSLSITPTPLENVVTDQEGRFYGLLGSSGSHTLDINREGYGDVTATSLNQETVAQIYLPPANDLTLNGNFEAAPALTNWTTGGSLPTIATSQRHTGNQAALLGDQSCVYPCLTDGENTPVEQMEFSDMVVDRWGNVHVAWMNNDEVMYSTRSITGTWASESLGVAGWGDVGLLATPDDQVHLIFLNGLSVKYATKPLTDTWSSFQTIATLPYSDLLSFVQKVFTDHQGKIHVLIPIQGNNYQESKAFHLYQQTDSSWVLQEISHPNVRIGIGPDGTFHFAWATNFESPGVFYQTFSPDGSWSNIVQVPLVNLEKVTLESIEIAPNGDVHILGLIVENNNSTIYVYDIMRSSSGTWSNAILHVGGIELTTAYLKPINEIAVDHQGNVHVVIWSNYLEQVIYRQWRPESGWQAERIITADALFAPMLWVDAYDLVHILALESGFGQYYHSTPAAEDGTAVLSQTVTIPADMPSPTLAFMFRPVGDTFGDDSGAEVWVTSGVTTTVVPLQADSSAWTHEWIDMASWAGQTITLAFRLTQAAGDPRVSLGLDDVSLGSAYPDVKVVGLGDPTALPGEPVTFYLYPANQGSVLAEQVVMTATLPAELTFLSATVPVSVTGNLLVWNVGNITAVSAASPLVFTAMVDESTPLMTLLTVPFIVTTTTPEVEVGNNIGQLNLFVGHRAYLPVVP